jgi:integrase
MAHRSKVPSYRIHKQSGQAIVTLPDGLGGRQDLLLGKYGSPESRAEYARVLSEWESNGRRLRQVDHHGLDLTLSELMIAYWKHAESHYRRPDGTPTGEIHCLRAAFRPLRQLYGHTIVGEFGPLALKTVRQKMIESVDQKTGRPWCRRSINLHISRIRGLFKWGVEQELVSPTVLLGLQAVRGLQKGRSQARESELVKPVPQAHVDAIIPYLSSPVVAMIQLQALTGMRPGEVIIMRSIDIETSGKIWLYRPGSDQGPEGVHKTAFRGHGRVVLIGPRGQEIVQQFLKTDLLAYLFQPREAMSELRAELRQNRKSKVQQSQINRCKRNPKRKPGTRYTVASYGRAISRACDLAVPFPFPEGLSQNELEKWRKDHEQEVKKWQKQHRWHAHQLRHAKATEIRREAGLDAARVVLGHRSPQITETYAEIDLNRAAEVMARLG